MTSPIRVAVTGAAGNIGYALLYRIANGDLFGPDQPISLHLLEITPALAALEGVVMELDDCAFPLLHNVVATDDANKAFDGVSWAMLVGARPRGPGMERKDLLSANGKIFVGQGKAINDNAADDVRVVVVGNPANTNCLIAMSNAPDVPNDRFTAMTRLDHNRAASQLAQKSGRPVSARIDGQPAAEVINDDAWIKDTFIPTVQKRGAAVIAARGSSSAASAANAAINHVQTWYNGTAPGNWISMGIPSTGDYGSPAGTIFSYPVTVENGVYRVVQGLELSDFDQAKIQATGAELLEERSAVEDVL